MKKSICTILLLPCLVFAKKVQHTNGLPAVADAQFIEAAAKVASQAHPRLFASAADFESLKSRLATDEYLRMGAEQVRAMADMILEQKPIERTMHGRRLLRVCRDALYRINTLSLAYRLYGDKKHLDCAVDTIRRACAFEDWNPSHFLDTAEMSLAVATGYDWLYNDMEEPVRKEIAAALRNHGIEPGKNPLWWVKTKNNWGQVCHAGMLAAALALAEDDQATTAHFIQRCIRFIPNSMASLAPNGNYPEGPGYWSYGTEFNVVALMMLEKTLGSDYGLCSLPGFKETANYLNYVTGPTGMTFNYADGGAGRGPCAMAWWFAKRFKQPDILAYYDLAAYRDYCTARKTVNGKKVPLNFGKRMFAYGFLYVEQPPENLKINQPLLWNAGGEVPITVQRSSWNDKDAMFVGIKGGSPSFNHGHMDGGSFILESQGIRWAVDLGGEDYTKIEQLGMNLWGMDQGSDRWKIFRLSTFSHNVLVLDGCQQLAKGFGKPIEAKGNGASEVAFDLTSLYTNATSVVRRGVMFESGKRYELFDRVEGLRPGAPIRWSMVTYAKGEIDGDSIVLTQTGRKMRLTQTGAQKGEWKIASAAGPNSWDNSNKGYSQITFTSEMPQEGAAEISVAFAVE